MAFCGLGARLPIYRLDTIDGPVFRVPQKALCPATNVTVLRHGARDTAPCEVEA